MISFNKIKCFFGIHDFEHTITRPCEDDIIVETYTCKRCDISFGNVFWDEITRTNCPGLFGTVTIETDYRHKLHK